MKGFLVILRKAHVFVHIEGNNVLETTKLSGGEGLHNHNVSYIRQCLFVYHRNQRFIGWKWCRPCRETQHKWPPRSGRKFMNPCENFIQKEDFIYKQQGRFRTVCKCNWRYTVPQSVGHRELSNLKDAQLGKQDKVWGNKNARIVSGFNDDECTE